MDRHKTHKHIVSDDIPQGGDRFKTLLDSGVEEAYKRPWHRIERGLRLNRLRIFIEEIAPEFSITDDEKKSLFIYLQKALDNRLLNTIKVVHYNQELQRITTIKGLELKRNQEGALKWAMKQKTEGTRKKKSKDESPSVSTPVAMESSKIEDETSV
jgi:hypothetical protein